jgi:hypothetical protein
VKRLRAFFASRSDAYYRPVKGGGIGHVHRPSGVPPAAAISLHHRELALGAKAHKETCEGQQNLSVGRPQRHDFTHPIRLIEQGALAPAVHEIG